MGTAAMIGRGNMALTDKSCVDFAEVLASKAPVPGGGGGSAMVGALGAALGSMVCNLTVGKKTYAAVEDEVKGVLADLDAIRGKMLRLVEEDAVVFEPLAKAYGIKAVTPEEKAEKDRVMEAALRKACSVPVEIVRQSMAALKLLDVLSVKGSRLAISDVAVGALFCQSALLGGRYNVIINTSLMKDREYAAAIDTDIDALATEGAALAEAIAGVVEQRIKKA